MCVRERCSLISLPTVDLLWSSIFVTLVAKNLGLLPGFYRISQISSRVLCTAKAALPLTKSVSSDFGRSSNPIPLSAVAAITQFLPHTVSGIRYIGEGAHGYNGYMQIPQLPHKAVLLSDIRAG